MNLDVTVQLSNVFKAWHHCGYLAGRLNRREGPCFSPALNTICLMILMYSRLGLSRGYILVGISSPT